MSVSQFFKSVEDIYKILYTTNKMENVTKEQVINTTLKELEQLIKDNQALKIKYKFIGNKESINNFNEIMGKVKSIGLPLKHRQYQKLCSAIVKILKKKNQDLEEFIKNIRNEGTYIYYLDEKENRVELYKPEE